MNNTPDSLHHSRNTFFFKREKPAASQAEFLGDLWTIFNYCIIYLLRPKWEDCMAEHIMHKKESKKAPQKTLKEKREEKKNKKKSQSSD
jgi:hypothetical protein